MQDTLGVWDYVVCGILVSATFIIGIYYAVRLRKRGNVSEYLFAERSMSFLPLTLSIQASFESAIMMLGMPAEGYGYGISYVYIEIGQSITRVFEQLLLLSFIRKLDLASPFEYLDLRFQSKALRRIITAICCLQNLLYMSIVSYGQAIAIEAVTGFSIIGSILVTGLGTVIYTSIGGLRAVIWADVIQIIFMSVAIILVVIKSTLDSGGFSDVIRRNTLTGRFDFDLSPDITTRHTLWNVTFGGMFYGLGFLFRPAVFQRVRAAKSVLDARRAILFALLFFPLMSYVCVFQGLTAFSYFYAERCDPVASKQVNNFNQIIPYLILKLFRGQPGLPGLFVAGLFSATISTISSCLSALATMTFQDFVKPVFPNLSEFKGVVASKLIVVIYGVISCGCAMAASTVDTTTIIQMFTTLVNGLRAPAFALFWLGLLFPFVNKKGAVIGLVTSICLYYWIFIGSRLSPGVRKPQHLELAPTDNCFATTNSSVQSLNVSYISTESETDEHPRSGLDKLYSISYTLYGIIEILTTMIVGIVASLIIGKGKIATDLKYIIPAARNSKAWRALMNMISSNTLDLYEENKEWEMIPQKIGEEKSNEEMEDDNLI